MNEELVEKAQLAMVGIIDTMLKAKDFAIEQAPEVISQLLAWKTVSSLVCFSFGVLLTIPCIYGLYRWQKTIKWGHGTEHDDIGWVFTAVVSALICGGITLSNLVWLKIWIAPKLYLLEYAASLAN